ncbi:hypothetical protein [Treponema pedis]|uniref:Uncharacterized protein n=1 Tax=Treponema pedis TaxID=409322 RepID=A0A7S6WN90_9SPIR|nr:hypothetical protein [Treponema pedis]QOW60099.1 hypothetical protein IFE08_09615 [Treponema pedis]
MKLKNGTAAEKTDGELKEFLQYMSRNNPFAIFVKKIKGRVNKLKETEELFIPLPI